ncbi:DNA-binding transcriptional regulator, MarR family [Novosphingobium sp. B1]|nr:DNA-binding transcriptional regulator, MarR family [Novosphingobium sp. B1]
MRKRHLRRRAIACPWRDNASKLCIAEYNYGYYRHGVSVSVAFLSSDIGRLFRKRFGASVQHLGVTGPQWRVLAAIKRDPGTTQGALASWLEVEPITAGRMVDRLEKMELVERRDDPADRRSWRLHLTAKGEHLLSLMAPLAQQAIDDAVSGLTQAEHAKLLELLERVRANLLANPECEALTSHG